MACNMIPFRPRIFKWRVHHLLSAASISSKPCSDQFQKHSTILKTESFNGDDSNKRKQRWKLDYSVMFVGTVVSSPLLLYLSSVSAKDDSSSKDGEDEDAPFNILSYGVKDTSKPTYSHEEVKKHNSKVSGGIWVTFRNGVYDVTDFVENHPGGDRILLAAGGSIEPFWEIYSMHKNQNVLDLLEEMRIGNIDDPIKVAPNTNDPWSNEPDRHPSLIVRSQKPFNAETPPTLLAENVITPTPLFFVRNHLPVPEVDPSTYRLTIEGIGIESRAFTLDELKQLPRHEVTACIQCSGNRRSEMNQTKKVNGLGWSKGAISNATWEGVRLIDLLHHMGVDTLDPKVKHLVFTGMDTDPVQGNKYGASVPSQTHAANVILALKMNGTELTRDHGYPVRVVCPGVVGARSVKWVECITLSETESTSHWQKRDYKVFPVNVDNPTQEEWDSTPALIDYSVQSAITDPSPGEEVTPDKDGYIEVKGYAWAGGGRAIIRMDVSGDGGSSWVPATINPSPTSDTLYRTYGWVIWSARVKVDPSNPQLVCKAIDSAANVQPEKFDTIWNFRGVMSNAWSRVNVTIKK